MLLNQQRSGVHEMKTKPDLAERLLGALRQQMAPTPLLAPGPVQRRHTLVARFTHFYDSLRWLPRWVRRRLRRKLGASLAGVALALALSNTPVAYADDITVTTTTPAINAGDNFCSLIEAIVNANNDAATYADCEMGNGADVITLAGGVYSLSGPHEGQIGLPTINSVITIQGNNATIRRGTGSYRIIEVSSMGDLTLNDTTISGGILGGIRNRGVLTLNNSTVSGNSVDIIVFGGGIYNDRGTTTLNSSTVSGNVGAWGGGIFSNGGVVTLNNSTVSGNFAGFGGGINSHNGTLILNNSTVSGNRTDDGYDGGGIYGRGSTITLTNSTISNNRADGGGGIFLHDAEDKLTTLHNTIIANNIGGDCKTLVGSRVAAIHSLIESGLGCVNETNIGNLTGDPNLGPLQDNGGPTLTHALLEGSQAINAGSNDLKPTGMDYDQRGAGFPRIIGGVVDIGAFEFGSDTAPPVASPTQEPAANAHGWNNKDVTVTWNWMDDADGSGIVPANCMASSTASGEGEHTLSATCRDLAGNEGSASYTVKIDTTSPTLNPAVSPNPVAQGATATVSANAADALSGIASASCDALDTSTPGVKSVTCTATDNAGNTASATVEYTVEAAGVLVGSCGGYDVYQANGAYTANGWSGSIRVGTNANNTLNGTSGPDLMLGLGGNDLLDGKGGDDVLCGGDGVDLLQGGAGNDYLDGGAGSDVLNGGGGDHDALLGGADADVLLDGDGVISAHGGAGNDAFTIALRNGWRNPDNQPRFTGLAAGYGNDAVGLAILGSTRFYIEISGDEPGATPDPLDGTADALVFAGRIEPTSQIVKFESGLVLAADAPDEAPTSFEGFLVDPTTLTDEHGAEFLSEPVGEDVPTETEQTNRLFIPLVSR